MAVALDLRIDRSTLEDDYDLAPAMWERLYELVDPDDVPNAILSLPTGQRAVLVLDTVQGQVDNGGFFMFLDENERAVVREALPAAKHVGAEAFVPLLQRVVELEPDIPSWDVDRDGIPAVDALAALDEPFFELCRAGDDLRDLALAYVRAHPDEFFLPASSS